MTPQTMLQKYLLFRQAVLCGERQAAGRLCAPDAGFTWPGKTVGANLETYQNHIDQLQVAIPSFGDTVAQGKVICQGNNLVITYTVTVTHGRRAITVGYCDVVTFDGEGKIVAINTYGDRMQLLNG